MLLKRHCHGRVRYFVKAIVMVAMVITMGNPLEVVAEFKTAGPGYEITLPNANWSLVIDLPGFVISTEEYVPDKQMKKMSAMKGEIIVSVYLERKPAIRTAQEFRNQFLSEVQEMSKKMPPGMGPANFRMSETGQMAVLEFSTKSYMEIKNISGFMVRDGITIWISTSKRRFKPGEEQQLWDILKSARIKGK